MLPVELDQNVTDRFGSNHPGSRRVGQAEVLHHGQLAIWLTEHSDAGRTARALLDDDILDVVLEGTGPTMRLR